MNKKFDLSLGLGGPTLLMSDGDRATQINGYALQALEDCVFSELVLDQTTTIPLEKKLTITAITNASNEFTLSADDIALLSVGDKIYYNHGGIDLPQGTVQDGEGRATELKDKSIYFVASIDTATNEITIEESVGIGAITLDDDGTLYGLDTYFARIPEPYQKNNPHGEFSRNASANDRTHHIVGATDGRIFTTYDDGGVQVNMFDTTGGANVGDVTIPRGMTVYLPITSALLTTGACIIYTKGI